MYLKSIIQTIIHYDFYFWSHSIAIYEYPFYCLFFALNLVDSIVCYCYGDYYTACLAWLANFFSTTIRFFLEYLTLAWKMTFLLYCWCLYFKSKIHYNVLVFDSDFFISSSWSWVYVSVQNLLCLLPCSIFCYGTRGCRFQSQ